MTTQTHHQPYPSALDDPRGGAGPHRRAARCRGARAPRARRSKSASGAVLAGRCRGGAARQPGRARCPAPAPPLAASSARPADQPPPGGTPVSRVQLALNVDDIDAAVAFYSQLFDAEPAKRRPGYANFALDEPALKLVLIENPGRGGSLNHLGVEVASTDEVVAATRRFAAAGLPDRGRGRHHLLLRAAGQGLGDRRRQRLGGLHGAGRRRRRTRGQDAARRGRPRWRRAVAAARADAAATARWARAPRRPCAADPRPDCREGR